MPEAAANRPMLSCRTDTVAAGPATLVHVVVTAAAECTVRVELAGDGPVWPPRRRGVPAAGWDPSGYEGRVAPGEPLAVGFATPGAVPDDDPVVLHRIDEATTDSDAADVVRRLGDPRPPRDAVAVPEFLTTRSTRQAEAAGEPPRAVPDAITDWLAAMRSQVPTDGSPDCGGPPVPPARTFRWLAAQHAALATAVERSAVE
jgi:hypothetical protein